MRKLTWPLSLWVLLATLAACSGPNVTSPTNAPTAPPVSNPTQAPAATTAASTPVAATGVDLGSATWKWAQALAADGTTTSIADAGRYTLQFVPAGNRVGIATTCQSATGSYTTDGHALKIKLEGMTNAVCPGDKLSGQFIAQLGSVESYSFDGSVLVLKLAAGGGSLRLTA
jgi:heat shock protein HslJ